MPILAQAAASAGTNLKHHFKNTMPNDISWVRI
jgi:hypothetical protein